MPIPIENIYYLLCYAWDKPEQKDNVLLSTESGLGLLDLFTKLLINSTKKLLKKGLEYNYIDTKNEVSGLKGKLEIAETLKSNILSKQKTICTFDEFSPDIINNRILFTTLKKLLKVKNLNYDLKQKIMKVLIMFPPVKIIKITDSLFKNIKFHRNNRTYEFILNICKLLNENLLPTQSDGDLKFVDFSLDERKMNKIYENFLFNFYKTEQKIYKVSRDIIKWKLEAKNENIKTYIPLMKTDITLLSSNKKIIIDAKFYKETLSDNYGSKKILSGNLYQIFSYLINQESEDIRTKEAKGILLYPTTSESYELSYNYQNHEILIKTINLNQHWTKIHTSLLQIIESS